MHLFLGEFCLLVLLLSSFFGFANVRAGSDQGQEVPAPQIRTVTYTNDYGGSYGLEIQQGQDFGECFGVGKDWDNNSGLNIMWQGNIASNVSGTLYNFQYILWTPAILASCAYPADSYCLPGVYINCSDELLPICLCNCSSFDMVTSNVTYINKVPTFTNTVTFHDIPIETYGNGNSTVTLVFTQLFTANWTTLTIKTDVFADLTHLKLYISNYTDASNYTEVPANASFSLNFIYMVGLGKQSNDTSWVFIPPTSITPDAVHFDLNGTEGNYSLADMSLSDEYNELQGTTTIPSKNATAYFLSLLTGDGQIMCNCIQTFTGLTYGLTTGIQSDPTINVQHTRVPVYGGTSAGLPTVLPIVGIATGAVLAIGVAVVHTRKKRPLTSAYADETQKQAEN